MKIEITLRGPGFAALATGAAKEVSQIVRRTAVKVEAGAKTAIQTGAKTGRVYRKRGGRQHQASAPGQAPATDEGTLVNSIQMKPISNFEAHVTVGAEHGAVLEFGGVNMAPRPFLAPAIDEVAEEFERDIRAALGGK